MAADRSQSSRVFSKWRIALAASVAVGAGSLFAQQSTTRRADGLDGLNDDALMNELAARGLNTLLDRAFEVNKVPQSQREGQRALMALARLTDPNARPTAAERQTLLNDAVRGIDLTLATTNDPNVLMRQAFVLITQGAEREVNTLEYWGENPRTQAALRPIMQAVDRILDKCTQRSRTLADGFASQIGNANSPFVAQYEQYEKLAATAEYTRRMAAYYLAISLDPASPDRAKIAGEAFDYLKQFDVPENADRCFVRNRMAKLAMAKNDLDTAHSLFASVIADQGDPKPTIAQQYEARYFIGVTDLLGKKLEDAKKDLADLLAWQDTTLPSDKAARDGADAAATMLKYRVTSLEAEFQVNDAARAEANGRAVAILTDLLARRPDLRAVIYDQLLPRLDDRADLTLLDPLLLRALIAKAEQELQRPADQKADEKLLQRGIDAAREVIRRKGSGIDAQMVDASSLLLPFFQDRLNHKTEAAGAFLDYADQFKATNLSSASLALDNAQAIIGQLRAGAETRTDAEVTKLYERFLPLAIAAPFQRKQFAFEYARRLQLNGDTEKAIEYFQLVPPDDKRALQAAFSQLVAVKQGIDDEPANSPRRTAMLSDLQKLADRVNAAVDKAIAQASTDEQRNAARSMHVRTILLAADLARREQKNPQRALQLLNGFESAVAGLSDAEPMLHEAMYIRVQSFMAQAQYTQATDELVKLLSKTEGAQGAQIVYNLLEKLNGDFDRAQQANDREAMRSLARSRAQLSGFLVSWAEKNPDPKINKFTYRYRVFDAETQRRAAELEEDANARKALLDAAIQRYDALQSPANVALYKSFVGAGDDAGAYDPQVKLGIALVRYEQGDFAKAAEDFSLLLTQRKVGSPVNVVNTDGVERSVDNDAYWEVVLKLIRSDQKLNTGLDEAKNFLKLQYVTWGPHVGGKKWRAEFESLRKDLIPEFKLESTTAPAGT